MDYKIVLSSGAEEDLDGFVAYLLFEKKSEQAARNLLNNFEITKASLSNVAGSLKLCDNLKLRKLGYHRINFLSHRYFMLYRIENDTVYVDNIFHELLLILYEVMNLGLTYFYMTGNIILKTGNLSVCQAAK